MKKIPVTVLSGYLGSGKTTLLNHLLHENHGKKIGLIVNDMGEINVDAAAIKKENYTYAPEQLIEMQNGCICCTLREDLLIEVKNLVEKHDLEYILIESSGISEPLPVAQTFSYKDSDSNIDLTTLCRLDTLATVVDARRFWDDYGDGKSLLERIGSQEVEDREIADLLIDQIEFANVILLNKIDLVSQVELGKITAILESLNPDAQIISTTHGKVNPEKLLNTHLFDFERMSESPGWVKELNEEHIPETEEYGIRSFVYKARKPFHPERLLDWIKNWPPTVVRAKGYFWTATRASICASISQAGSSVELSRVGTWIVGMPTSYQEKWLEDPEVKSQ